jgi:RNA recognition motif. (a.k.a. RRM, RBD, or RNP domain)
MESVAPAVDPTILASKRAVYVGDLADAVTPQLLRAAMIPFGPIKSLDMVSLGICACCDIFGLAVPAFLSFLVFSME